MELKDLNHLIEDQKQAHSLEYESLLKPKSHIHSVVESLIGFSCHKILRKQFKVSLFLYRKAEGYELEDDDQHILSDVN